MQSDGQNTVATISGAKYAVLWYDSKMKTYELFIEYLAKKRFVQADIMPILVVDKETHMEKVRELWETATDDRPAAIKQRFQVLLRRDLTDQE